MKERTLSSPDNLGIIKINTAAAYQEAAKLLDRSGRKRIIHPNTAARQKSRLAKLLKK